MLASESKLTSADACPVNIRSSRLYEVRFGKGGDGLDLNSFIIRNQIRE